MTDLKEGFSLCVKRAVRATRRSENWKRRYARTSECRLKCRRQTERHPLKKLPRPQRLRLKVKNLLRRRTLLPLAQMRATFVRARPLDKEVESIYASVPDRHRC